MANFVAVRYDAENGEGLPISKRLGVEAFPAFVIVNADGTVLDRFAGAYTAPQMIGRLQAARR